MSLAALAPFMVACGSVATPPDAPVASDNATDDAIGLGDGFSLTDAPPPCPFDLDAIRASGITVRYALNDGPGVVRTELAESTRGRELEVAWSERSVDGFDEGIERYVCTPAGLALIEVTTTTGGVAFAPPVLVLPGVSGEGEATGTLAVHDEARSTVVDAAHVWSAADTVPPSNAPTSADTWRVVRSVLAIELDGVEHTWQTETLWAVDDDRLVPIRRQTTFDHGHGTHQRIESADQVTGATDRSGPPPLIIPGR